jgi:Ca2+-binding RTX toxin-like protein
MATITGTNGANRLRGTSAGDILRGLGGNDSLSGLAGNDRLEGGTGNDILDGRAGADVMTGGAGNDVYIVDRSTDRAVEAASGGTDLVRGGVSYTLGANIENLMLTGAGNINGVGNGLNNVITGNRGGNTLDGRGGRDTLFGGLGVDVLFGGAGNDRLVPGPGNGVRDVIDGGPGVDTLDYSDALRGVRVSLAVAGFLPDGAAAQDVIAGIENVIGSRFADVLQPGAASPFNLASGGGGNDFVGATPGVYDRIRGDDGYDLLSGFDGSPDDFWLQYERGTDRIANFENADNDHVLVSRAEFNLATPAGRFIDPGEFVASAALLAPTSSVRLLHETDTGILWADKDGIGAQLPVPIASFDPGITVAGYIFVIA